MFVRVTSLVVAIALASIACAATPEPTSNQQKAVNSNATVPADPSPSAAPAPSAAPSEAPSSLTSCCDGRAKCVPDKFVSEKQQQSLASCDAAGTKCVPNEFVADPSHKGKACAGNVDLGSTKLPYDGVCLSDCLHVESQNLLSKEGCATGEFCAPCIHPVTSAPTGAPGCPGS
jgi:hypothetical protein